MLTVNLTAKSRNAKTGPIPVSTTSASTCPDACPFKKGDNGMNGCYADGGPLAILWRKVSDGYGLSWDEFCQQIEALPDNQLWRHNQAGDLPGINDDIDVELLVKLIHANRGKKGFTYTHKPMDRYPNIEAVKHANNNGFTVNLSGNNPTHADTLADLGIGPVVTVLPSDQLENTVTPKGRKITVCPAVTRDDVSCASCGLCAIADRQTIIGFPAHGMAKKKATAVAMAA